MSASLPIDLGDLVLRRVGPRERNAIHEYYSRPEMAQYQFLSSERLQASIEADVEASPTHPGLTFLAIVLRAEDKVVGDCTIDVRDPEAQQAELGYGVHPDYWGRSFGTRAVKALVDYGFRTLDLNRIFAGTDCRNERSVRLLERVGLRREAHFREEFLVDDEWMDTYVYAVLRKEWLTRGEAEDGDVFGASSTARPAGLLTSLFEHHNWANLALVEACAALDESQLAAKPDPLSKWSVREALHHLVESQQGYLALLTLPPGARKPTAVAFEELHALAKTSGEALLALADRAPGSRWLRTTDGYDVEPWVVLVQVLNHAADHRRQICGMLRAQGLEPPWIAGWAFGEKCGALIQRPAKDS